MSLARVLGPALLALAFTLLAAWSWGRWADVQIDFGLELYTAWRLSEGAALYRDLAYRNGPLSPWLNAFAFALFGTSVRTLVLCNLAVIAAICALLWRIVAPVCGRFAATVAGLVFLCVFAFSQVASLGNYNYVTPYQHAQTHGLALALAMIAAFAAQLGSPRSGFSALAGLCVGAVFLTKAELFLPAALAAGAGLGAVVAQAARSGASARRRLLAFAGGALLPSALAAAALLAQMPRELALTGLIGNWAHLDPGIARDPFYAAVTGLDAPRANLVRGLRVCLGIALFAGLAYAADRALARSPSLRRWSLLAGVATGVALLFGPTAAPWMQLGRALPFTSFVASGLLIPLAWNARRTPERFARLAPLALLSLYALALFAKMPLHGSIAHYGFVLAMPATLLLALGFVYGIPRLRRDSASRGQLARSVAIGAVVAGILFHLAWASDTYRHKNLPVGAGADQLRMEDPGYYPRAQRIARALAWLEERLPPDATLLVLPEGLGLNYWLRRANPSRFGLFLPTELRAFGGEQVVLADLRAHSPDWVALLDRPFEEFGVGPFGANPASGREILRWVEQHYRRELRIGPEPFRGEGFGIVLLRRAR